MMLLGFRGVSNELVKLFNRLHEQAIELIAGSGTHHIIDDFNISKIKLANEIAEKKFN
jgi:hypothetical protein